MFPASNPAKRVRARAPRANPFQTDKEGKLVITEGGEGESSSQYHPPAQEEMEVDQNVEAVRVSVYITYGTRWRLVSV